MTLDDQLLVPRSTAEAHVYDVNDVQTTVYAPTQRPDANAPTRRRAQALARSVARGSAAATRRTRCERRFSWPLLRQA